MTFKWFNKLNINRAILGFLLCLSVFGIFTSPALADLPSDLALDQQILAKSLHSLRDDRGQAWQVVFFKRQETDREAGLYLRLVAFPGMGYPRHTTPLRIVTGTERVVNLPDVSTQEPQLTRTAGQYDMQGFVPHLHRNPPLKLHIPIQNSRRNLVLTVPPFVVQAWREAAAKPPTLTLAQSVASAPQ